MCWFVLAFNYFSRPTFPPKKYTRIWHKSYIKSNTSSDGLLTYCWSYLALHFNMYCCSLSPNYINKLSRSSFFSIKNISWQFRPLTIIDNRYSARLCLRTLTCKHNKMLSWTACFAFISFCLLPISFLGMGLFEWQRHNLIK